MKADQPNAAQLEAHQCHKDRLKRIAAKAVRPVEVVEVVAPVELEKPAEPTWEERQWEIPLPVLIEVSAKLPPTVENIVAACAGHFKVARRDLKSKCRAHYALTPRHIAMYLARKLSRKSLPEIGRRFGGRDHTTIIAAIRKIERKLHSDSDLAFDVAHIELSLEAA